MKPCQEHKETLLLDLFGELTPDERPAWEKHLERCQGCSQERERILHLLQLVKEGMPKPALSPDEARILIGSIERELRQEKRWWQKRLGSMPNRLIPALAAACLLIVALGWFTMSERRAPSVVQTVPITGSGDHMIATDLDVIRNLDLLKEMETLQKLVQIVNGRKAVR